MTETTIPEVFIIESLHQEDIDHHRIDGKIVFNILKMNGMKPCYKYVRSFQELKRATEKFGISKYRYLHLSFHGSSEEFDTFFGSLPFNHFSQLVSDKLAGKRVFVSACKAVSNTNFELANLILRDTGCNSLVGSYTDIDFIDAALLWSSFYYLCFRDQTSNFVMKRENVLTSLRTLTALFRLKLNYFSKSRSEGIKLTQICNGKDIKK
jgi:hypothetical protein